MLCSVQQIVAIWWPATELQQAEVSIEFELRANIVSETSLLSKFFQSVYVASAAPALNSMGLLPDT